MKLHSIITALILTLSLRTYAQEAPTAVERLRASYTAAVKRVTDPLKDTYRNELNKLLDQYTKSGKLDDALAVRNELAALDPSPKIEDTAEKARKLTKRQFEKQLLESKWLIGQKLAAPTDPIAPNNEYTFSEDGNFRKADGDMHSWRLTPDGELFLFTEAGGDWGVKVTQNQDGSLTAIQTGKKWPQDRFFRIERVLK